MEEVRPARAEDVDRCVALVAQARESARAQRGGPLLLAGCGDEPPFEEASEETASLAVLRRYRRHDPDAVLFVGLFEHEVVGVGAGHVERRDPFGLVGLVDCCYVEPGARQVGVGGALAEALVSWFGRRGCAGVDAPALPGDRATKQLFEAAGFSARLLVLHRRLP